MKVSKKARRGRKRNPVPHRSYGNYKAKSLKRKAAQDRRRRLAELAEEDEE